MNAHSHCTLAALGLAVALAACSGASKTEEIADDPAPSESGSVKAPNTPAKSTTDEPSTDDGANSTAPSEKKADPAPESTDPEEDPTTPTPQNGVNRISVNQHCCYGDQYFVCPSPTACFGGFDVDACLSTCAGPADPCFTKCFEKEASAPPPKGCQAGNPPKGIDCANGNLDF